MAFLTYIPAHLVVLEDVPAPHGLSGVQCHHADEEGVEQCRQEESHVDLLEQMLVVVLRERQKRGGTQEQKRKKNMKTKHTTHEKECH